MADERVAAILREDNNVVETALASEKRKEEQTHYWHCRFLREHERVVELEAALGSFLGWYDRRYPGGEGSALPGLTLWGIAEEARDALKGTDLE